MSRSYFRRRPEPRDSIFPATFDLLTSGAPIAIGAGMTRVSERAAFLAASSFGGRISTNENGRLRSRRHYPEPTLLEQKMIEKTLSGPTEGAAARRFLPHSRCPIDRLCLKSRSLSVTPSGARSLGWWVQAHSLEPLPKFPDCVEGARRYRHFVASLSRMTVLGQGPIDTERTDLYILWRWRPLKRMQNIVLPGRARNQEVTDGGSTTDHGLRAL